ncbi:aldose epimerase [Bordetella genomosp. 1]|uniref:Aldose epimerase n=1 Tax=Bordetella genomosp. 1 TaxID=1395607 RepID=A0A261SH70_9BORD|nr:aldose epimerase [Bordetella genomosp. 1]OZI36391.1 aldose epimerase [Bordetella genomosp. 1]OZI57849.1 aldose epimerase [Bordetella genomosp. 1]
MSTPATPSNVPWLDATQRVSIASGAHQAEFSPGGGGRLTALRTGTHDWVVPITEPGWPTTRWPRAGSYPLAPYSNRIRDGRYTFEGRSHQLESLPGRPHALHGSGLHSAWTARNVQADSVELVLAQPQGVLGWPSAFECVQHYRLSARGLALTLSLHNQGEHDMPFGFGVHPYFTARRVQLQARRYWPAGADGLPQAGVATRVDAISCSREGCDTYLSQWGGRALLEWPDGHRLSLEAEPAFEHLVVYSAPGASFLCVEPVTNVADAFNLAAAGVADTGMRVLAPGARFSSTMHFVLLSP